MHAIHTFLSWPQKRVQNALAQLAAINDAKGGLSRAAIEHCPNQEAAETLHLEVKKAKSIGKPLTEKAQLRFVKQAATETKKGAARVIREEVRFHARPGRHASQPLKDFEDAIGEAAKHAQNLSRELKTLNELKSDLNSEIYRRTIAARFLWAALAEVRRDITALETESLAPSKPEKDLLAG